jgi:hypothetical protein
MMRFNLQLEEVVHASNLITWEAEAGGSQVWDQLGVHNELQTSQGYIARPCLKKIQTYKLGTVRN